MKYLLLLATLILVVSCNKIQRSARDYNDYLVDQESELTSGVLKFAELFGQEKFGEARQHLGTFGKTIEEIKTSLHERGIFNGQDTAFHLSLLNMASFIEDTAIVHYNGLLNYRTSGDTTSIIFDSLANTNIKIFERLNIRIEEFGRAQNDFAKKYEFKLTSQESSDRSDSNHNH